MRLLFSTHQALLVVLINILLLDFFFFVINIFFIFSHITQHSIQNITKQYNRHILNISKSSQKRGRRGEGRTIKTQKSLLYIITYIKQKNTAKHQWSKDWPLRLAPCVHSQSLFAGGYGSNIFSTHVQCKPVLDYCLLRSLLKPANNILFCIELVQRPE